MQAAQAKAADKIQAFMELGVRLAWKTRDDVRENRQARDVQPQGLDSPGKIGR